MTAEQQFSAFQKSYFATMYSPDAYRLKLEMAYKKFKNEYFGAGRVGQVIEQLACKCEALSSNPRATKKKKKEMNIS
jgi:hypothetical protein